MQVNEPKDKYDKYNIFKYFWNFSLKNNEKQCYMQTNAKYFCLLFSNNFKKSIMQLNAIWEILIF